MENKVKPGLGQYTAVLTQEEDGLWLVHISECPECRDWGLSENKAKIRIRERLALFFDDALTAELVVEVQPWGPQAP